MTYNFDEIIDRKNTNSINEDGWRDRFGLHSMELPAQYPNYIRMWVADMDFATPPEILDAVRERLNHKILGYTNILDDSYHKVLAQWFLKRYNWAIHAEHIVISAGVVPALNRLIGLVTKEDEGVLITTPSYGPFKAAADRNMRRVFYSSLTNNDSSFDLNFDDLVAQLDDPQRNIRLFILCNPHNPTGRIWSREELQRIGEICLSRNIWVISDEVHCDLLRRGQQHIPLASLFPQSSRIITCTAPSKTFNLAGNLMSHIFIPDATVRNEWNERYAELLSPLAIAATKAAYSECEDWLEQLKAYLDTNFSYLEKQLDLHLPETRFHIPGATYLSWIDVSAYTKGLQTQDFSAFFAREAAVILEGGNMFIADGEGYIRLNIACPLRVLEEGVERLISVLKPLKQ